MASFQSKLQPASFRKVPFGVLGSDIVVGRRDAVHEYPYRDLGWVEDMGRAARKIRIHGFVVGDDAIEKRDRIIKIAEDAGDGELVHPSLGRIQVALLNLQISERWDQGRVFELAFDFIEQGLRQFPTSAQASSDAVKASAASSNAAASASFAKRAGPSFQRGDAVLQQSQASASSWGDMATKETNNSTTLLHLTDVADGQTASTQELIGTAAASRQNVTQASDSMKAASAVLTASNASNYGGLAQGLAEAVRAASPRPADAIRAMEALISFSPIITGDGSPIGIAIAAVQAASRDLFRRAALVSASMAATNYQPSSNDDAAAMRNRVLTLIDDEITNAGDLGEDDVFRAMRDLRSSVSQDLNERGAGLPDIVLIKSEQPVPSLVLAQRLYRDASRAGELEAEAGAPHPAFMPTSFRGLSA